MSAVIATYSTNLKFRFGKGFEKINICSSKLGIIALAGNLTRNYNMRHLNKK